MSTLRSRRRMASIYTLISTRVEDAQRCSLCNHAVAYTQPPATCSGLTTWQEHTQHEKHKKWASRAGINLHRKHAMCCKDLLANLWALLDRRTAIQIKSRAGNNAFFRNSSPQIFRICRLWLAEEQQSESNRTQVLQQSGPANYPSGKRPSLLLLRAAGLLRPTGSTSKLSSNWRCRTAKSHYINRDQY